MSIRHLVRVGPLPPWLDRARLLGPANWTWDEASRTATSMLSRHDAADITARLRGLGFGGDALAVVVTPPLPRAAIRAARTEDARRRRDTTPGFSRSGTRVDSEGRVSLTPEALALSLGNTAARRMGVGANVIDAGCGCGGNAIGFARAGLTVTAVELDPERIALARHNASIYGVADRITFLRADAAEVLATRTGDLAFLDPPWGGTWNRQHTTVDDLPALATLMPPLQRFDHVWLKVPPSFDPTTLPDAWTPRAVFGEASGDRQRVKFLLLERS